MKEYLENLDKGIETMKMRADGMKGKCLPKQSWRMELETPK